MSVVGDLLFGAMGGFVVGLCWLGVDYWRWRRSQKARRRATVVDLTVLCSNDLRRRRVGRGA